MTIMKQQILVFLIRWALNALGLWVAVRILGTGIDNGDVTAGFWGFVLAGLIFSIFNSLFKPLLVIVSLALGVYTLSMAASLDKWLVDRMYYRVGTDLTFTPFSAIEAMAETPSVGADLSAINLVLRPEISSIKEWKKYGTQFTSRLFYFKGYYISRLDGQGSYIKIEKKNGI